MKQCNNKILTIIKVMLDNYLRQNKIKKKIKMKYKINLSLQFDLNYKGK